MKLKGLLLFGALAAGAVWLYRRYKEDEEINGGCFFDEDDLPRATENEDADSDRLSNEEENGDEA